MENIRYDDMVVGKLYLSAKVIEGKEDSGPDRLFCFQGENKLFYQLLRKERNGFVPDLAHVKVIYFGGDDGIRIYIPSDEELANVITDLGKHFADNQALKMWVKSVASNRHVYFLEEERIRLLSIVEQLP